MSPRNDNCLIDAWFQQLARNRRERIAAEADPVERERLIRADVACGVADRTMVKEIR